MSKTLATFIILVLKSSPCRHSDGNPVLFIFTLSYFGSGLDSSLRGPANKFYVFQKFHWVRSILYVSNIYIYIYIYIYYILYIIYIYKIYSQVTNLITIGGKVLR